MIFRCNYCSGKGRVDVTMFGGNYCPECAGIGSVYVSIHRPDPAQTKDEDPAMVATISFKEKPVGIRRFFVK